MAIVFRNGVAGKKCANPACAWKPLTEFHPRRLLGLPVGDGYKSRCRECWNAQKRSERAAKPEKYRETAQTYVEANQEHIRKLKRRHQEQNPQKYDDALRKHRHAHRQEINAKTRERRGIWSIIAKSVGIHMSATRRNDANTLLTITSIIPKNRLQPPIVVVP